MIQDPSVVSVKDDGELAKHLETFRQFCASGGLISFLDDRKVQLYVGSLWAGARKKALSLGLNPPWPICLLCDPSCCDKNAKTSRILLAPDQRLTDLIGASEMQQEPFGDLLVDERRKRTALCASPGMQLDQIVTVINASLEGWRVSHLFPDRRTLGPRGTNEHIQITPAVAGIASRRNSHHPNSHLRIATAITTTTSRIISAGPVLMLALGVQLVSAATGSAGSGDFAGLVDIGGGRKMYLECRGTGSPTVVLVAGLKGSAEDWNIAGKPAPTVFAEVAKFTRVCAYDRPGTPVGEKPSRSDPVRQPTTAEDAVADLHALLSAANEAGPYVLVGHSYGGLIVRLYASIYPQDVSGLVLVDVLSEGLQDAETPEQWAMQRILMEGDIRESLALYPDLERNDPDRSFDQVRAAQRLRPLP